jgi:hypothetical protein
LKNMDNCEKVDSENRCETDSSPWLWGTDPQGQIADAGKSEGKKSPLILENKENTLHLDKLVLCGLRTNVRKSNVCNPKANYVMFFGLSNVLSYLH